MAPLAAVDTTENNRTYDYTEKDAFDAALSGIGKRSAEHEKWRGIHH